MLAFSEFSGYWGSELTGLRAGCSVELSSLVMYILSIPKEVMRKISGMKM